MTYDVFLHEKKALQQITIYLINYNLINLIII